MGSSAGLVLSLDGYAGETCWWELKQSGKTVLAPKLLECIISILSLGHQKIDSLVVILHHFKLVKVTKPPSKLPACGIKLH